MEFDEFCLYVAEFCQLIVKNNVTALTNKVVYIWEHFATMLLIFYLYGTCLLLKNLIASTP